MELIHSVVRLAKCHHNNNTDTVDFCVIYESHFQRVRIEGRVGQPVQAQLWTKRYGATRTGIDSTVWHKDIHDDDDNTIVARRSHGSNYGTYSMIHTVLDIHPIHFVVRVAIFYYRRSILDYSIYILVVWQ
jgi:hypothetical protein